MAKQPLRGSMAENIKSIASTLQLALDSAKDEKELRAMIKALIKNLNPSTND